MRAPFGWDFPFEVSYSRGSQTHLNSKIFQFLSTCIILERNTTKTALSNAGNYAQRLLVDHSSTTTTQYPHTGANKHVEQAAATHSNAVGNHTETVQVECFFGRVVLVKPAKTGGVWF